MDHYLGKLSKFITTQKKTTLKFTFAVEHLAALRIVAWGSMNPVCCAPLQSLQATTITTTTKNNINHNNNNKHESG